MPRRRVWPRPAPSTISSVSIPIALCRIGDFQRHCALSVVRVEPRYFIVVSGAGTLRGARERFGAIGEEQPHLMIRTRRHFQLSGELVQRAAREADEIERYRGRQRKFQPRRIVDRSGGALVNPQLLHRDAHVRVLRAHVRGSSDVHAGVAGRESEAGRDEQRQDDRAHDADYAHLTRVDEILFRKIDAAAYLIADGQLVVSVRLNRA